MTTIAPKPPKKKIAPADAPGLVGKKAFVTFNGLSFEVLIEDIKVAYGHARFLVTPVAGKGAVWVGNIDIKSTH